MPVALTDRRINSVDLSTGVVNALSLSDDYGSARYRTIILGDNPEVYLRVAELSGLVAKDETVNGHDGIIGATGVTYGKASLLNGDPADRAMQLNGVTGKIDIPYSAALNTPLFTVEIWLYKLLDANFNNPLWDCRPASSGALAAGFDLFLNGPSGQGLGLSICKQNQSQIINTTTAIPNFEKHLAHAVYDGTSSYIYVDNALRAGPTVCPFTQNPNKDVGIGHLTGGANFAGCVVDEIAYYPYVLSTTQRRNHLLAGNRLLSGKPVLTDIKVPPRPSVS